MNHLELRNQNLPNMENKEIIEAISLIDTEISKMLDKWMNQTDYDTCESNLDKFKKGLNTLITEIQENKCNSDYVDTTIEELLNKHVFNKMYNDVVEFADEYNGYEAIFEYKLLITINLTNIVVNDNVKCLEKTTNLLTGKINEYYDYAEELINMLADTLISNLEKEYEDCEKDIMQVLKDVDNQRELLIGSVIEKRKRYN